MIVTSEQDAKMQDKMLRYWLAINGPSAALCNYELSSTPTVSPIPKMLIGFPTSAEAVSAQQICLKAPIPQIRKQMQEWKDRQDVKIVVFKNPEPPTSGPTSWALK